MSEDYFQFNRKHWNVWARRDWPYKKDRLKQIKDGGPYLEDFEPKLAPYLSDIRGKKVIVLQFGDGLVLLACAKKGAVVAGVDFCREQIRLVEEAAKYCNVNVNLVEADCQNLPESIPTEYFDLAVAECGIFGWIWNLYAWMQNAYKVLKHGGKLAVSDFHPLSATAEEKEGKVIFRRSYFDQNPEVARPEENVPPAVWFHWKLSDIINTAIQARFHIDCVEEYYVEKETKKVLLLPTDFLLVATKE
jgi:SAM-dependent methyltransferase